MAHTNYFIIFRNFIDLNNFTKNTIYFLSSVPASKITGRKIYLTCGTQLRNETCTEGIPNRSWLYDKRA